VVFSESQVIVRAHIEHPTRRTRILERPIIVISPPVDKLDLSAWHTANGPIKAVSTAHIKILREEVLEAAEQGHKSGWIIVPGRLALLKPDAAQELSQIAEPAEDCVAQVGEEDLKEWRLFEGGMTGGNWAGGCGGVLFADEGLNWMGVVDVYVDFVGLVQAEFEAVGLAAFVGAVGFVACGQKQAGHFANLSDLKLN